MTIKPDPLKQLLQCLNRAATTAQVFSITEDIVYLSYSTIMSKVKFSFFEIYKRMISIERVV
jgi:phosphotransacetylase